MLVFVLRGKRIIFVGGNFIAATSAAIDARDRNCRANPIHLLPVVSVGLCGFAQIFFCVRSILRHVNPSLRYEIITLLRLNLVLPLAFHPGWINSQVVLRGAIRDDARSPK